MIKVQRIVDVLVKLIESTLDDQGSENIWVYEHKRFVYTVYDVAEVVDAYMDMLDHQKSNSRKTWFLEVLATEPKWLGSKLGWSETGQSEEIMAKAMSYIVFRSFGVV